MDWNSIYQSRVATSEKAIQAVKSGDRIFMTGNVSVPQTLLAALVAYAPNLKDVQICHVYKR
jgi:4-hydroxybutyrate CoA-transferase